MQGLRWLRTEDRSTHDSRRGHLAPTRDSGTVRRRDSTFKQFTGACCPLPFSWALFVSLCCSLQLLLLPL